MLTKKIANFSDDLLNTVRGILGEAKKHDKDCECEKCEAEDEMKEGAMPTADEPTEANKKTAQKIRDMMAKEKKPVKEDAEQLDEISADMAHRYLKGKRERDYDISPDGKSSKLKKPQSFDKMNKDMKSTVRALKTIEKAKKANELLNAVVSATQLSRLMRFLRQHSVVTSIKPRIRLILLLIDKDTKKLTVVLRSHLKRN
jgi:hypothetical protein